MTEAPLAAEETADIESKIILEEVPAEDQQLPEEEEIDPRDEVRCFIKKSRNPDYLEWELVSRHFIFRERI